MTEPVSNNPSHQNCLPWRLIETIRSDPALSASAAWVRLLDPLLCKAFDKSPAQFVADFLRPFQNVCIQSKRLRSRIEHQSDLQFTLTRYVGKGSGRYDTFQSWQTIWDLAVGQKAFYARRSAPRPMHFAVHSRSAQMR